MATTTPRRARASLSAAVSLVLRLVGRESDPARSEEHVLRAVLAERRLRTARLRIGALPIESFLAKAEQLDRAA